MGFLTSRLLFGSPPHRCCFVAGPGTDKTDLPLPSLSDVSPVPTVSPVVPTPTSPARAEAHPVYAMTEVVPYIGGGEWWHPFALSIYEWGIQSQIDNALRSQSPHVRHLTQDAFAQAHFRMRGLDHIAYLNRRMNRF